jgi:hypothetical protein
LRAHHPESKAAVRGGIKPLRQPNAIVNHFDQEGIRDISPAVDPNRSGYARGMGVLDRIGYGLANDERERGGAAGEHEAVVDPGQNTINATGVRCRGPEGLAQVLEQATNVDHRLHKRVGTSCKVSVTRSKGIVVREASAGSGVFL